LLPAAAATATATATAATATHQQQQHWLKLRHAYTGNKSSLAFG